MEDSNDSIMKLLKKLNLFFCVHVLNYLIFQLDFDMPPILLPFCLLVYDIDISFFLHSCGVCMSMI
jgi:hypothetical protein